MRILVLGRGGTLARALAAEAAAREGVRALFLGRRELGPVSAAGIAAAAAVFAPDALIDAAAFTDVDGAENGAPGNAELNIRLPACAAAVCAARGIPLVHVSTDYVFGGEPGAPYAETDRPRPVNAYGMAKLAGEAAAARLCPRSVVVRTSWLFAPGRPGFVTRVGGMLARGETPRVPGDQTGGPTPAGDLARVCLGIAARAAAPGFRDWGIYHYCGFPYASRRALAEFVRDAAARAGICPAAAPVLTRADAGGAPRPRDSSLACRKIGETFGIGPADWRAEIAARPAVYADPAVR